MRNLFTHFSGLRPDVPLDQPWTGYDTGIRLACTDPPAGPPGARYVYSDINFILLGEMVHRLSGQMLADYARDNIFQPLGMKETMFQPPAALEPAHRAHRAWPAKNGAALARRSARPHGAQHGRRGGPRRAVFHGRRPGALRADDAQRRRAGWRARLQPAHRRRSSPSRRARPISRSCAASAGTSIRRYSGNRGELFPIGSYGHTGFTGTSIWIDPSTKTYVILLANSVHPDRAAGAHAAARESGDHRGRRGGDRRRKASSLTGLQRDLRRRRRAPRGGAQRRDRAPGWTCWRTQKFRRWPASASD